VKNKNILFENAQSNILTFKQLMKWQGVVKFRCKVQFKLGTKSVKVSQNVCGRPTVVSLHCSHGRGVQNFLYSDYSMTIEYDVNLTMQFII